jgi:hypothetical protein
LKEGLVSVSYHEGMALEVKIHAIAPIAGGSISEVISFFNISLFIFEFWIFIRIVLMETS